jgi:hypothetical protein
LNILKISLKNDHSFEPTMGNFPIGPIGLAAANNSGVVSTTVLGRRRERSSSPCPRQFPGDRNRLESEGDLGFHQSMDEDEQQLNDEPVALVQTAGGGGRGGRGGGRGGGARGRKKCRTRGANAPPPWSHDPRPSIRRRQDTNDDDLDLQEEFFEPSLDLKSQNQRSISISGRPFNHPEPEIQVVSPPGHHFILSLALLCRKYLDDPTDGENKITQTLKLLTGGHDRSSTLASVMFVNSLENLAERCAMSEENVAVSDFVFMVNAIQLRCKVIRSVLLHLYNLTLTKSVI